MALNDGKPSTVFPILMHICVGRIFGYFGPDHLLLPVIEGSTLPTPTWYTDPL